MGSGDQHSVEQVARRSDLRTVKELATVGLPVFFAAPWFAPECGITTGLSVGQQADVHCRNLGIEADTAWPAAFPSEY